MDFSKASGKINHNLLLAELRGCSYEGELAQLGGIARLGEMIFIPRSYGMKSSILVQSKSLLCRWKKIVWSSNFYNKQWCKAIMQNKCSYIIYLTSEKQRND